MFNRKHPASIIRLLNDGGVEILRNNSNGRNSFGVPFPNNFLIHDERSPKSLQSSQQLMEHPSSEQVFILLSNGVDLSKIYGKEYAESLIRDLNTDARSYIKNRVGSMGFTVTVDVPDMGAKDTASMAILMADIETEIYATCSRVREQIRNTGVIGCYGKEDELKDVRIILTVTPSENKLGMYVIPSKQKQVDSNNKNEELSGFGVTLDVLSNTIIPNNRFFTFEPPADFQNSEVWDFSFFNHKLGPEFVLGCVQLESR